MNFTGTRLRIIVTVFMGHGNAGKAIPKFIVFWSFRICTNIRKYFNYKILFGIWASNELT